MLRKLGFASFFLSALAFLFTGSSTHAQVASGRHTRVLITQNIDEGKQVALKGNTRHEANAKNDRGAVADEFPIEHMLLQLQRPPELEKALQQFMMSCTIPIPRTSTNGSRRRNSERDSA